VGDFFDSHCRRTNTDIETGFITLTQRSRPKNTFTNNRPNKVS